MTLPRNLYYIYAMSEYDFICTTKVRMVIRRHPNGCPLTDLKLVAGPTNAALPSSSSKSAAPPGFRLLTEDLNGPHTHPYLVSTYPYPVPLSVCLSVCLFVCLFVDPHGFTYVDVYGWAGVYVCRRVL